MLTSIGAHAFALPTPVFLVGTYGADRRPNIMTAAWGGICCSRPPCIAVSLRRATWTHGAIAAGNAFTVSIPSRAQAAQADFAGLVSGASEDKFQALGLTPVCADHVDAPYVAECPVAVELALRHTFELGSHTQFVGEIMDVKIDSACLRPDGLPDPARIDALCFAPMAQEYYSTGQFVARAFAVGKTARC